ncbi:amidohydrolase family protein [Aquibium oceanicum]|uniref:Amidohydrolase-related domain-containing protein n=1 Tax=Aquibium oceanicum TaxID=1670800 RepID=A0A1L3SUY7_9HYPH|nr:amidohydrolase family protein [Aquibium oceanicum]APH73135.1 hypothetical protein BSQ44_18505 [Aquibium oceanicum]
MYDGPIIDPHHHLWDISMGKHPWLDPNGPIAGAIPGLASIANDFVVEDYVSATAKHNVVASVHIEALWDGDPVGETEWLETLDKNQGVAIRYVGGAALQTDQAAEVIARQAAFDRMVGIRGILSSHPDASKSFVENPHLAKDPIWRGNVELLAKHGLNLELMMYPYQADDVVELASSLADLTIVINHCGSPIDRDEEGMQRWRDGLRKVATAPNTRLKISNLGAYDPQATDESFRHVVLHCIDCFGADRAMFGSDYPVSRIQMDFDEIYSRFKEAVSSMSADEQRKLFHDNAKTVYRM